ncbi:amino acid transporter [Mycobacterium sp. E796]|nr:amino acid transporter [Mycobacterium sp. E796]
MVRSSDESCRGQAAGKGLRPGAVGLKGSLVIALSSVAPAYSLAAVLAGMVAATGAKSPALFVIGFVPMLLTAFAFRELARETPDCGSTFTWVTRAFGPWVGWLAGWCSLIAAVVAVGNGAQIAAIYLLEALHLQGAANSMAAQIAAGGLAVVVLTLLCVRGIDVTERTQAVLVGAQFVMLALVSVIALTKVFGHHAGPQAVIPQWSWLAPTGLSASAIAHGMILCVFAYWGWDACLSVSEETRNPHKNPGKAAVLATVVVLGTYVMVSCAIQAFAGFDTTGIGLNNPLNANDALAILGNPVVGGALAVLLLLAISSSALASALTSLAKTARNMLAMAVYRALPQRLARVNRYRTPWLGTVLVGAGGFATYLVMMLLSRDSLADMVASVGLMTAFYYAMTAYACVWTYRQTLLRSARDFWLRGGLPLLGALGMTWVFLQSTVDMYAPDYGKTHVGPVGGVFILGMGLVALGVPVAVLSATAGGRDFFRGKTLDAATEITVPDATPTGSKE